MLVKILVVLIVLLNRCESIDRNDLRPLSDTSLAKFHYIRDEPVRICRSIFQLKMCREGDLSSIDRR